MSKALNHEKADILIVDDTPENLQLLNGLLKKEGYKVRLLPNGKMAINAVNNEPPVLILLDINMPEMDGYEVCKILKSSPKTRDVPIIFLTAKTEMEDLIKGFKLGAVDYITKPFNQEELLARVKTHTQLTLSREKIVDLNDKLQEANQELTEWNEKLEDKLDEKTKEIHEMNKILHQKNEILKNRDKIMRYLLDFHPIEESMQFIFSIILTLVKLQKIIVYISTDENEYSPRFGLTSEDKESLLKDDALSKFPVLPGLSPAKFKKAIEGKDVVVKKVNDYSLILPLVKGDRLLGYILLDNTVNQTQVDDLDFEICHDFSLLIAFVLNDHQIRQTYSKLENSVEDILGEL
ncbi:MAG: response regulator [bacterium]|nr:response regulator [bacterium]